MNIDITRNVVKIILLHWSLICLFI